MDKVKTLFVVPALCRAGAESQLVRLVRRIPRGKVAPHVFSYRRGDDLVRELQESDVHVHFTERRGKIDFKVARAIARVIDDHQIDVVHCTLMNALIYGVLGCFVAHRKPGLICVIHTTKNVDFKHDLADRILHRYLLRRCRQIWFVSENQARQWIGRMPFISGVQKVIHNGIDIADYDVNTYRSSGIEFRRNLGIGESEMVGCCIAGLRPEKLHLILVEAMSFLRERGCDAKMLLAGSGPMEDEIRQAVSTAGLHESVIMLGALTDVRPVLAAANFKVLPSAAETFSMAMLEAMSMELPVISTRVGGASEAIEHGISGALVAPNDAQALADEMEAMFCDPGKTRQMGEAARRTVEKSFQENKMVQASVDCLVELHANS